MDAHRKTATVVGVLFIAATLAGVLSVVFGPNLAAPDYLTSLSANPTQGRVGGLLEFAMAVLIAGIAIWLYPVLRKHSETLAVGYVVARTIEVVVFTVAVISLLALVTLSREYAVAGSPDAPYFQTLGALLLAVREWGGGVCATIVFGLSALMLNYVLFGARLVPRWVSGWGLVGAALYFASGFFPLFGYGPRSTIVALLNVPLGLQEMVLAVWLVAKGFRSTGGAADVRPSPA